MPNICVFGIFFVTLQANFDWREMNADSRHQETLFSPLQMQLLSMLSRIRTEKEAMDIRNLVANYYAERAFDAMDALWEEGKMDENTIADWKQLHERTPYAD